MSFVTGQSDYFGFGLNGSLEHYNFISDFLNQVWFPFDWLKKAGFHYWYRAPFKLALRNWMLLNKY